MNSNRPAMRRNRRVPGITGLVLLTFLASAAAQASEKDELASVQRQLDQVQARDPSYVAGNYRRERP